MKNWPSCEILIPLRFNEGRAVPKLLLVQTLQELEDRFNAVSAETQVIHELWRSGGRLFRDDLIRVYVDVEDNAEVKGFFASFKNHLKTRFQQLDIWLTSSSIEVL